MNTTTQSASSDAIAARAYQLWEAAGRPESRDQDFWLRAEQELKATPKPPNTTSPASNGAPRSGTVRERRVAR